MKRKKKEKKTKNMLIKMTGCSCNLLYTSTYLVLATYFFKPKMPFPIRFTQESSKKKNISNVYYIKNRLFFNKCYHRGITFSGCSYV